MIPFLHLQNQQCCIFLSSPAPSSQPHFCLCPKPRKVLCFQGFMGLDWAYLNNPQSLISRSVTLIILAKYLLPCKVTYPQVLGIKVWTSLWAIILPIIKRLLEMYWTLCLLLTPFYFLHDYWYVNHFILSYDHLTVVLGRRRGKQMS